MSPGVASGIGCAGAAGTISAGKLVTSLDLNADNADVLAFVTTRDVEALKRRDTGRREKWCCLIVVVVVTIAISVTTPDVARCHLRCFRRRRPPSPPFLLPPRLVDCCLIVVVVAIAISVAVDVAATVAAATCCHLCCFLAVPVTVAVSIVMNIFCGALAVVANLPQNAAKRRKYRDLAISLCGTKYLGGLKKTAPFLVC
jgi:hypothetical protein